MVDQCPAREQGRDISCGRPVSFSISLFKWSGMEQGKGKGKGMRQTKLLDRFVCPGQHAWARSTELWGPPPDSSALFLPANHDICYCQ